MAYVFGIEGVPLFEMLFVIMILMLFGLIFVLLELRKLTKLLREEQSDIQRFEKDLTELEQYEGQSSVSKETRDYVKVCLDKGIALDKIRESFLKSGWPEKKVDDLFKKLKV